MTIPQQIEILDIRHFSARQLRPLLEQEATVWQQRLRWDYRSSTELLIQYLDSHLLPGFVALLRGRVCGYCFCVFEGQKAVIGDLYTSPDVPAPLAITHTLARHLLEMLEAAPNVDRIEAQLLLFDPGVLPPAFASIGSTTFPRLFLELVVDSATAKHPVLSIPPGIVLSKWRASAYNRTAELILSAYAGHVDSQINDQYKTLEGSLRFLHNIVRFPGCGTFDPEASWILEEQGSETIVGVLLCSRVAPDTAHITQLCVAPAFRGRGLGKLLLNACICELPAQRYDALTLTVSEANASAVRLYFNSGFHIRQRFDAMVIEKAARPNSLRARLALLNDPDFALPASSRRATPARS